MAKVGKEQRGFMDLTASVVFVFSSPGVRRGGHSRTPRPTGREAPGFPAPDAGAQSVQDDLPLVLSRHMKIKLMLEWGWQTAGGVMKKIISFILMIFLCSILVIVVVTRNNQI